MKKIVFFIFFISASLFVFAQQEVQLAMQYFRGQEYSKAEVLFYKLYKSQRSDFYFNYYVDCLIYQDKFDYAEKKIRQEIRRNSGNLFYTATLGYLFRKKGNDEQADKIFKEVFKELPSTYTSLSQMGHFFVTRREYEWAEQVYKKGEDSFPGRFLYNLASVYAIQRKYALMVERYLDFGDKDYSNLGVVKNVFKSYMRHDANNEFSGTLERGIILRIQRNPDDEILNNLIIWFYTQQSNYFSALIYGKAFDKRTGGNGAVVYQIGLNSVNSSDLETAEKAFSYIVSKGRQCPYYNGSRSAMLSVMYKQAVEQEVTSVQELERIESEYKKIISELPASTRTTELILELSDVQSYFLHKDSEALILLQNALKQRGLSAEDYAKLLLKLGDVYLHFNMPWDAVLTYARVERDYSNYEITDEAKFKKAKTYFYLKQFSWSDEQWQILKGSPSKLIANDAIYWSNFVRENKGEDSNFTALAMYAEADYLLYKGNISECLSKTDSIILNFAELPIIAAVYYLRSQVYRKTKEYYKAVENLQKIVTGHQQAMWADKAVFELGTLYEKYLNDPEKAKEMYKKLLFDFKGSIYTDKARKNFRRLESI